MTHTTYTILAVIITLILQNAFQLNIFAAAMISVIICGIVLSMVGSQKPVESQKPTIESRLKKVSSGQNFVVHAIILNILFSMLFGLIIFSDLVLKSTIPLTARQTLGLITLLVWALAIMFAFIGLFLLASGLDYPSGVFPLLCFIQFIPLISLITLLQAHLKANKELRNAGYEVGLLGVRH